MPEYDVPQAGSNRTNPGKNVTCLDVGQSYVMFDGTETPAVGLASVAFARGTQGSVDGGVTFNMSGDDGDAAIDVQVASINEDANFTTVATLTPSAGSPDTGNAAYTDLGRSAFYRLYMSAYSGGAMPVVVAQR